MHVQLFAAEEIVWEKLESFRDPIGDERGMMLRLKSRLAFVTVSQPVDTIVITLSGIGWEMARQARLWTNSKQRLDQFAAAIRPLQEKYGRSVVGRMKEVNPSSRHPEERAVFVPYDG